MQFPDAATEYQKTSCAALDQTLNLSGPRFCFYELGSLHQSPEKPTGFSSRRQGQTLCAEALTVRYRAAQGIRVLGVTGHGPLAVAAIGVAGDDQAAIPLPAGILQLLWKQRLKVRISVAVHTWNQKSHSTRHHLPGC